MKGKASWTPTNKRDRVRCLGFKIVGKPLKTDARAAKLGLTKREIAKLCEEWVAEILADGPIWYKDLITLAEEKKYSDGQLTRVKGKLNIQDDWAERKIKGKKPKKEKFWFLKKQAGVKPKARETAKSRRF